MPLSEQPGPPVLTSNLSDSERHRLEDALVHKVMLTDVAKPFVEPPDTNVLAYVPLPLCLKTVVERLRNRFYRSGEQVKHDLQVLCRNSSLAPRPDETLLKRSRTLEEALDALFANEDVDTPLAKWNEEAEAAEAAARSLHTSKVASRQMGSGAGAGCSSTGSTSCSKAVVAKVSPESVWQNSARAGVEAFDHTHGDTLKRLGAATAATTAAVGTTATTATTALSLDSSTDLSLDSSSHVHTLVNAWQCCEYATLIGKVAAGDYRLDDGISTLGYDLLCVCCRTLLLLPSGSEDRSKARKALHGALHIIHELKSTYPRTSAMNAPTRSNRRAAEGADRYKARLESLILLDADGLLKEPFTLPANESEERLNEGGVKDTKLSISGLDDIVALAVADWYRSPEEVGLDLLMMCASAMLQQDDEALPGSAGLNFYAAHRLTLYAAV